MTKEIAKLGTAQIYNTMLNVKKDYRPHIQEFIDFIEVSGHDLAEGYRAYFRSLETDIRPATGAVASAGTYNIKLSLVKDRIRYLFDHSPDAFDMVKRLQMEKALNEVKAKKNKSPKIGKDKVLSQEEIRLLVACLNTDNKVPGGKSIALMVEFLGHTGARVSEMLGVTLGDVKKARGKHYHNVRLLGKGRKERFVKVNSDIMTRIRAHFHAPKNQQQQYLFEHAGKQYRRWYVSNQIKAAGRIYIDREIAAHTLRHSFITEKIAKTHKITAVSEYVGHSSVATTLAMYNHEELEDDELGL